MKLRQLTNSYVKDSITQIQLMIDSEPTNVIL
jgi:hypothetical protein